MTIFDMLVGYLWTWIWQFIAMLKYSGHTTPQPQYEGGEMKQLESYEKKHADSGPPVGNKKYDKKKKW